MNRKLVGIVALLLSNFVLFASAKESVEKRIAQKSQANRIEANLVKFNQICERNKKNQPVITYDAIRLAASFGSCQSTKKTFRALHAQLPRFYDIAALQQAQIDMQTISKKLPK